MISQKAKYAFKALVVLARRGMGASTSVVERVLRRHVQAILAFENDNAAASLEIY